MTSLRITGHYDVPIEKVFELGTDFKRYPEWNVSYLEVKEVTGPPDRVGTRIHAVMRLIGRTLEGWAEVAEVEKPRYMKLTGTSFEGGKTTVIYRLTPAGTGTDFETEIEYELPAGIFGQIADKLFVEKTIERDLRHSMESFKALVEAGTPILV
jgi:uncharacterized membrane protein